ncbi:MAG: MBL fold metallo-hydrolase [Bacteroidia bacterium]|nr:MBL fold metallo-hydrolase [Bacteroidia bacterium]
MKKKRLLIFLSLILCAASGAAFAQINTIRIKFIGNCGLYMSDGKLDVYVDFPYQSGAFNYMKYDKAELDSIKDKALFIFTHRHPDHYAARHLRKLNGKILGPWKVAKKKRADLQKLRDSIPDFSVQVFKTKHRFSSRHSSYLLSWHGKKIFLSGDTEMAETIAAVPHMDLAFVPYWILADAKEKGLKINAEKFIIYHLYPDQKISGTVPENIKLLQKQGEVLSVPY